MLQEAKHLKRQLLTIISNTISTTAILEINHFTCSKDIWNWQSDIINNEGSGFALALGSGRWGVWALLCHTNTMLKEFKVYKTSKFLLQYCHAIYMLTRLKEQCQVSRAFMSSLAVRGFGLDWVEDFTPLLAVAFQGKVTDLQPFCLASGKLRRMPSARIHD